MKSLFFSLMLLFCSKVFSETALHAHEHGVIVLETGVEGKVVTFSVDGPAETFIGFEYLPKTVKEKKVFNDAKNLWEKNFFQLIKFEKAAGCIMAESSFDQKVEGVHSDIEASAKITCARDLKGEKISVNLRKYFKNIKKLKMEIIGNETKSVPINTDTFQTNL